MSDDWQVAEQAREDAIIAIINRERAWVHVAIWYISAIIAPTTSGAEWVKWTKLGRVDRRYNISRLAGDLHLALHGKALERDPRRDGRKG